MCKEFYCLTVICHILYHFNNYKTKITQNFLKKAEFYIFFLNEPELVLNLFLFFGKKQGSSSYKLGFYKVKRV